MERNAELILMVGVLSVPASAILVRSSQVSSRMITAYRPGWAVLLLLPVVLLWCRAELRRVTARDLVLRGASSVSLILHFLTWFESLKRISVASSMMLVNTEVIFTALGSVLFLHGKILRLGVWAILLAFGGSAPLVPPGGDGAGGLSGNLLALAVASAVAIYILIGWIQWGHLSTTVYIFLTYLARFLAPLLGTVAAGTSLTGCGGQEWLVGLALAVLCAPSGHNLFSWCLEYLSSSYMPVARLCEPALSSLVTIPLLGEAPGPLQLAGGTAVPEAVFLYTWAEREKIPTG